MSKQSELNSYIRQLHARLRRSAWLRGAAILAAAALATTLCLVLILNAFAFPLRTLPGVRLLLLAILAATVVFAIALPLLRLTQRRSIGVAEAARPEFEQRLITFAERQRRRDDDRQQAGSDASGNPFLELLAADTLKVAQSAAPQTLVPDRRLHILAGAGIACAGVLIWMIAAAPGFLGYGASLIWTGPRRAPIYEIKVTPGDAAVRRNSDQLIAARISGMKPGKVVLYARYGGTSAGQAGRARWEAVAMQPQRSSPSSALGFSVPGAEQDSSGAPQFQFLLAGIPDDVEYYVMAGTLTSPHYKIRVVDLPSVRQIQVTYRYPKWTGLQQVSEEQGGDLRAIEGTDALVRVRMSSPLRKPVLALDGGEQAPLAMKGGNVYEGTIHMEKDGAYHVAAIDHGQQVRLSEDYFIATDKANPPEVAITRPAGDYRASPIEEVTIGVKAEDPFGLKSVSLHYSVNGGADHSIELPARSGQKSVDGSATLSLEDFKLVPGDVVSVYATARDGHSDARTDIAFIQADPFERDFSQSQQSGGGGGGGGGGQGSQTDISRREKELIGETWKHENDKNVSAKDASDAGKFLSGVQIKLLDEVTALSGRMESRDLSSANEEFNSFAQDMQSAAAAMQPSADKLKRLEWRAALTNEQKALQYLLRAEATFRQIQVAFGQQGGGGGNGGSAGRDLASLFDLELDTQKNQYETAQTGTPEDQRAKAVDDALQKLDALARRQEALAQQQNNNQSLQERWQQEMLRRQAEQLQRQLDQMAQNGSQAGQQGASGSSSSASSSRSQSQSSKGSQSSSQGGSNSASAGGGSAADPRLQQAISRLRQAEEDMKQQGQGQGGNADAARRAAEALRQAQGLLGGSQQQQASNRVDSLANQADSLNKEERAQANQIKGLAQQPNPTTEGQYQAELRQRDGLANERQQLSDDLSQLQANMRNAARELAPEEPGASSKLRDALSAMDQSDLGNQVQRSADWLRRGVDPNSNGTESNISAGLQQLSDQLQQARQGLAGGKSGQGAAQAQESAALDQVERLRQQIEQLAGRGQNGSQRAPGALQRGAQSGAGNGGQNGSRANGYGNQNALSRGGSRNAGQPGGQQMGGDTAQNGRSGDVANGGGWRGGQGTVYSNVNTGNNRFDHEGPAAAPDTSPVPADSEADFRNGLTELNQVQRLTQNDPEAQKETEELIREMQHLDPKRFPGNPALVEQLHTQVLSDVDKLELQLRQNSGDQPTAEIRSTQTSTVPNGYQDAVSEYFRRLSKTQ